jgi:hypothetical protein
MVWPRTVSTYHPYHFVFDDFAIMLIAFVLNATAMAAWTFKPVKIETVERTIRDDLANTEDES